MVSLMPSIPLPSTSAVPVTRIYERQRRYSPKELATFQFDPALLIPPQIRVEVYKDEKDDVGPRTICETIEGNRILLLARSVAALPLN